MNIATILTLGETALKLGLICSLTVLALFLSYSMLNVCDLSTDGCFTLGAAVGATVAISGHPFLSIPAAMAAGVGSGFVTAILQTKMGVDSLLAGIIVNTGLYSVNIAVMGGSSLLNMNSDHHRIYDDEGCTERYPSPGKDRDPDRTDRSGDRGCVPCIFPENKTWSCDPGYRKQSGYG